MNKTLKGGSVLWMIVSIICLSSAGGLLFFLLQERTKRIETEEEMIELVKSKRAIEKKLDQAQLELIQLKDQAEILAQEFAQERETYTLALEELEKKDAEVAGLESKLAAERKQRLNLANSFAELRKNYDSLAERLKEAKTKAEDLRKQLVKSPGRSGVELKRIVVKPKKKELDGKVLVVNKEFHFVVINLGKKDDVKIGDQFIVYQGSKEFGRVEVERVYELMSTASILSGSEEHKISEDSMIKSF